MLSNSSILELAEEPHGWQPGDRLVVASTDYSMHQAEEFTILPCLTCTANQVKVQGMISTECPAAPALLELLLQLLTERADFLSWFPLLPFPHVTPLTPALCGFFFTQLKNRITTLTLVALNSPHPETRAAVVSCCGGQRVECC